MPAGSGGVEVEGLDLSTKDEEGNSKVESEKPSILLMQLLSSSHKGSKAEFMSLTRERA